MTEKDLIEAYEQAVAEQEDRKDSFYRLIARLDFNNSKPWRIGMPEAYDLEYGKQYALAECAGWYANEGGTRYVD